MTDRIARRPHGRTARRDVRRRRRALVRLAAGPRGARPRAGRPPARRRLRRRRLHAARADADRAAASPACDHSRDMVRLAGPDAVRGNGRAAAVPDAIVHGRHRRSSRSSSFPTRCERSREMRRVLDPERGRIAHLHHRPGGEGHEAAPYPLATRGHFYTDDELARLPREAGLSRQPRRAPGSVGPAARRATLSAAGGRTRRGGRACACALVTPGADHDLERRDRAHRRRDGARVLRRRRDGRPAPASRPAGARGRDRRQRRRRDDRPPRRRRVRAQPRRGGLDGAKQGRLRGQSPHRPSGSGRRGAH